MSAKVGISCRPPSSPSTRMPSRLTFGADQEMNQRALNADKVFCVTRHEKVRVQFALRGLQQVDFQGALPFAALPDDLLGCNGASITG